MDENFKKSIFVGLTIFILITSSYALVSFFPGLNFSMNNPSSLSTSKNNTNNNNTINNSTPDYSNQPSTLEITSISSTRINQSEYDSHVVSPKTNSSTIYDLKINLNLFLNNSYSIFSPGLGPCSFWIQLVNTSDWQFGEVIYHCPLTHNSTYDPGNHYFYINEYILPQNPDFNVTFPINITITASSDEYVSMTFQSQQFNYLIPYQSI